MINIKTMNPEDLPTPAWVGLLIASVRTLLDWQRGVSIWTNIKHVALLYCISLGVSCLSFMAVVQPGTQPTSRDIVICAVITFFGINIANSFRKLGEDMERNPLHFFTLLIAAWRTAKVSESEASEVEKEKEPNKGKGKAKGKDK